MTSSEWLPPPVPFEIVRRGYSPDQVTAHIEKLEYDLRIATANRDATSQRLAELAAQLSTAQAEADALRAQLDRQALEPMSMSGLSDRMQRLIRIAEEEAAETRSTAEEYSIDLRERAESDVAALRSAAEKEAAELRAAARADASRMRAALQSQLSDLAEARSAFDAERDRTRAQLAEQVSRLVAEATAQAESTRAVAREEAERLTAEAEDRADRLISEARQEAERLAAEAAAKRTEQEEDFTLAITARRAEAHRSITEAEQTSRADADARIRQADEHARRLVASATEHANGLVARAAAESHQRVLDADRAVQALMSLRSELHQQLARLGEHLSQVHGMLDAAGPVLQPPPAEPDRPRPDDFPADPAGRPTVADGFAASPPVWQPPEPPVDPADRRAAEHNGRQVATEHPVDQAVTEQPVTEQPVTEQPVDQPVTERPAGADPATPGPGASDETTVRTT